MSQFTQSGPAGSPTNKALAFASMTSTWMKLDTLTGGADALKAAGIAYMPKATNELEENYKTRLSRSLLVPYYTNAIDNAVACATSKPLTSDNIPAQLVPLLDDLDSAGTELTDFALEGLWNTINHGATYIVVDYPYVEDKNRTLSDVQSERPYLVPVTAPQVLAAYSKFNGAVERLTHFRWMTSELTISEDGLEETHCQVVRAYVQPEASDPVLLRVWRLLGSSWQLTDEIEIAGITEIPVVCAYGWKTGFYTGKPVLESLADLNIGHWISVSEQSNILSVARVPFIHAAGDDLQNGGLDADGNPQKAEFSISPHKGAVTSSNTTIKWVETSGASIQAGLDWLKWLEDRMSEISLTLKTSAPGTATATATAINAAEAHAKLKSICGSYATALSKAIYLMSVFANCPAPNACVDFDLSVDVPTDTTATPQTADAQSKQAETTVETDFGN